MKQSWQFISEVWFLNCIPVNSDIWQICLTLLYYNLGQQVQISISAAYFHSKIVVCVADESWLELHKKEYGNSEKLETGEYFEGSKGS